MQRGLTSEGEAYEDLRQKSVHGIKLRFAILSWEPSMTTRGATEIGFGHVSRISCLFVRVSLLDSNPRRPGTRLGFFIVFRLLFSRPTMATNYSSINRNTPYGSGDPYYNASTGYISPLQPPKKKVSNWIKFGVPIAVLVIAGAVLGGIFGSRASKSSSASSAATSAIQAKNAIGIFPTATDSLYMLPLYPATVCIPLIFLLSLTYHHAT